MSAMVLNGGSNGGFVMEEAGGDVDYYHKLKSLEKEAEFLDIQEEYIKDEMKNLQRELIRAKEELKRIQV
jgi:26S proteasome regulatory subunit T3